MTIVGNNMTAVLAELKIPVMQMGIFAMTTRKPFTVYEVEDTNLLVNIPKVFLAARYAWFEIPSVYRGDPEIRGWEHYIIAGRKVLAPLIGYESTALSAGAGGDILTFIQIKYRQLPASKWALLYTMAEANKQRLFPFIKTFARKW